MLGCSISSGLGEQVQPTGGGARFDLWLFRPIAGLGFGPECLGNLFVALSESKVFSFLSSANFGVIDALANGSKIVAALFTELGKILARCVVFVFLELGGKVGQGGKADT